jgi:hypothetical protein
MRDIDDGDCRSFKKHTDEEAERTIADNERRARRSWTSSDLGTSGSQTVGPCPWAQHRAPAKGFPSDEERSALHEEIAMLQHRPWEIRVLRFQFPAVMQTPLDVRGST